MVDLVLMSVLRDGLLRRSEAAELRWGDVEIQEDGAALLHVRRSKTDQEAEGTVLYVGQAAALALQAIMPEDAAVVDPATLVFGLSASQIGRRVNAVAKAAGLGELFHRPLGKGGHGPGPGGRGGGAAGVDDGRPVEELTDAGALHRAPGGRTGRGGQVLPGERGLAYPASICMLINRSGAKSRRLPFQAACWDDAVRHSPLEQTTGSTARRSSPLPPGRWV